MDTADNEYNVVQIVFYQFRPCHSWQQSRFLKVSDHCSDPIQRVSFSDLEGEHPVRCICYLAEEFPIALAVMMLLTKLMTKRRSCEMTLLKGHVVTMIARVMWMDYLPVSGHSS